MWSSLGVGEYVATEQHVFARSRLARAGESRVVYFCHAANVDATNVIDPTSPIFAVTQAGLAVAAGDLLGSPGGFLAWGNDSSRDKITTLRSFINTRYTPVNDKVLLWAGSMGAVAALRWAKANPTLVAAIALEIPAVDVQDIYTNNRGGFASAISTAWGGGAPTDADNPADFAASVASIPIKVWYSTNDPICTPTTVTAFASAVGASIVSLGAVGHAVTGVNVQEVADFLSEYA